MKKQSKSRLKQKKRSNPKIVATALIALIFVVLAFWDWLFIIPALILWWINKKAIQKHFTA